MKNHKLLIVSYKLGTKSGVGGRRWLNYGLELLRKGHEVYFLTYESNVPEELIEYKDRVFLIEGNYPVVLRTSPKTFLNKLRYRYWLLHLNHVNKGIVFDETVRTKNKFLEIASILINNKNISHLIITAAPFSLLHFGALLKEKFPMIKFISDYRDSWTEGIGYGIKQLSKEKFQYELACEKKVLKNSDIVLVASKDIEQSLKKITPTVNTVVLPNFVNIDQFNKVNLALSQDKSHDTICITHIGSINNDTSRYWIHFLTNISRVIKQSKRKIICQFIGGENKSFKEFVDSNKLNFVIFFPNMKTDDLASYMINSDFFVFFKHDEFPHSFPTKYFDYVFFRKPLLCYSISGEVTNEIESNKIGFVFDEKTSFNEFNETLLAFKGRNDFNQNYDYTRYSLVNLVNVLEKEILS